MRRRLRTPVLSLVSLVIAVVLGGNVMAASASAHSGGAYVALGDSVAAGVGLGADPAAFDARCKQSKQGYPHLVAAKLGLSLVNRACSNATAGDLVSKQAVDGPNIPAQLHAAFAQGTPQLITITAGANDVTWNEFMYACYQSDCTKTRYDLAARGLLKIYKAKLVYAFDRIEERSGSQPPAVIITGYYNPISQRCTAQTTALTRAEIKWIDKHTSTLNGIIKKEAAKHDFARYVPISFSGHDVCSKDSWVQGLDAAEPLHPTAAGQAYIAKKVSAAAKRML